MALLLSLVVRFVTFPVHPLDGDVLVPQRHPLGRVRFRPPGGNVHLLRQEEACVDDQHLLQQERIIVSPS